MALSSLTFAILIFSMRSVPVEGFRLAKDKKAVLSSPGEKLAELDGTYSTEALQWTYEDNEEDIEKLIKAYKDAISNAQKAGVPVDTAEKQKEVLEFYVEYGDDEKKIETIVHCPDLLAALLKPIQDERNKLPKESGDKPPYKELTEVLHKAAMESDDGGCGIMQYKEFQDAVEFNGGKFLVHN